MLSSATDMDFASSNRRQFATTQWSVVLAAGREDSPAAREALSSLCEVYWYPLYAFVRRQGYGPQDAEDFTQAFLSQLLERQDLRNVNPQRGKFRSFLLACLKNFLANQRDRAMAQKRGGGLIIESLDANSAEARYRSEPADEATAERVFDRQWARLLLERTLSRLRDESLATGKTELFDALKVFLTGEKSERSQAEIASDLAMSEDAVKSAVYRLRRRFRQRLRDEIAQTVANSDEIEEELDDLFAILQG